MTERLLDIFFYDVRHSVNKAAVVFIGVATSDDMVSIRYLIRLIRNRSLIHVKLLPREINDMTIKAVEIMILSAATGNRVQCAAE